VVELEDWDNAREYDRTGLDQRRTGLPTSSCRW